MNDLIDNLPASPTTWKVKRYMTRDTYTHSAAVVNVIYTPAKRVKTLLANNITKADEKRATPFNIVA